MSEKGKPVGSVSLPVTTNVIAVNCQEGHSKQALVRDRCKTHLQGECSYRRTWLALSIQHRSIACSQ